MKPGTRRGENRRVKARPRARRRRAGGHGHNRPPARRPGQDGSNRHVRRGGIHERLRGDDAMFFKHGHEHLGVDDQAGVKQFHVGNLAADTRMPLSDGEITLTPTKASFLRPQRFDGSAPDVQLATPKHQNALPLR